MSFLAKLQKKNAPIKRASLLKNTPVRNALTVQEKEVGKSALERFRKLKMRDSIIYDSLEKKPKTKDEYEDKDEEDKKRIREIMREGVEVEEGEEEKVVKKLDSSDNFPYMFANVPKSVLRDLQSLDYQTDRNGVIMENYMAVTPLNRLTSRFSERARMKCRRINAPSKMSPHDYYLSKKEYFDKKIKDVKRETSNKRDFERQIKKVRKEILTQAPDCSYFNISRVIYLFKYLFGKNLKSLRRLKWLDMSAGWGDRLIGAIALSVAKYTGIDPSSEMEKVYPKIIDKLVSEKNKGKFNVFSIPFEELTEDPKSYDIAFTSPPFFDFEIYNDDKNQSTNKWKTVESWTSGFLLPYVEKAWRYVKEDGYLVLYIEDKGGSYVRSIESVLGKPTEELKMRYDDKPDILRTFYIWKKTVDKMTEINLGTKKVKSVDKKEAELPEDKEELKAEEVMEPDAEKLRTIRTQLEEECDEDNKLLNPDTGNCVKTDGTTASKVMKKMKVAVKTIPMSVIKDSIIEGVERKSLKTMKYDPDRLLTKYADEEAKEDLDIGISGTSEKYIVPKRETHKYGIIAPAYFQHNREKFLEQIRKIFRPYKKQIDEEEKSQSISCESRGSKSGDFSLMTHQQIVRDYINMYTPYRGLLIYHGLGSGKTCTSIGIAEGIKENKQVIIMTPASLQANYRKELKNCGDALYTRNNHWVFISNENPIVKELREKYKISQKVAQKNGGIWAIKKGEPNFNTLTNEEQISVQRQVDSLINQKYRFINYNGLRETGLNALVDEAKMAGKNNPFDNAVVIVDEAHNLVSRIVNKINAQRKASLPMRLYKLLMEALDCRIVFLSGTPIINYPNEIGVIFNILRGYILTFKIPIVPRSTQKITKELLMKILQPIHNLDYLDYNANSKILTVTMNPYGFVNNRDKNGVVIDKKMGSSSPSQIQLQSDFMRTLLKRLSDNDITTKKGAGITKTKNIALPDSLEEFNDYFIDNGTGELHNNDLMKRRIIGLTSYYRSAQEKLMPRYKEETDYFVEKVPMSDYQFGIYESIRQVERKQEAQNRKRQAKKNMGGDLNVGDMYKDATSTYRIFSRAFCNFVFPKEIARPMPKDGENMETLLDVDNNKPELKDDVDIKAKETMPDENLVDATPVQQIVNNEEGEYVADDMDNLENKRQKYSDKLYQQRIKDALQQLKDGRHEWLMGSGLKVLSPKFSRILENILTAISKPEDDGLHLIYSSFRNIEGIEVFRMVLEANGFSQFKIRKTISDGWKLDMTPEELAKPSYMLYTGTEDTETKEMMRNIYNNNWSVIPESLREELSVVADNNINGDIIKVIMITASGAEGIDLKNTRYVHIMESYWHPVRAEQVIGRARRICSHMELPKEKQTVKVFMYLMTFTEEQKNSDESIELRLKDKGKLTEVPLTSDEALDEISYIKKNINRNLLKNVKESAMDCSVHNKVSGGEGLVCYNILDPKVETYMYKPNFKDDPKDTVQQLNMKKKVYRARKVRINGKDYAVEKNEANKLTGKVFDLESFLEAQSSGGEPIIIGYLRKDKDGKLVIKEK